MKKKINVEKREAQFTFTWSELVDLVDILEQYMEVTFESAEEYSQDAFAEELLKEAKEAKDGTSRKATRSL